MLFIWRMVHIFLFALFWYVFTIAFRLHLFNFFIFSQVSLKFICTINELILNVCLRALIHWLHIIIISLIAQVLLQGTFPEQVWDTLFISINNSLLVCTNNWRISKCSVRFNLLWRWISVFWRISWTLFLLFDFWI